MKLLYLTNIPAPYRVKRFNDMTDILKSNGIDLEVLFMAKTEPNRNWQVDENEFHFTYRIWPGVHPQIGGVSAHFNPTLLWRLLKNDYDIIIITGIAFPTLLLAPFFVGRRAIKVLSVETNLLGNTKKRGIKKWLKHFYFKLADAFQVTGKLQQEYIQYFYKDASQKKFIKLPNLINGEKFYEKSNLGVAEKSRIKEEYNIPTNIKTCIIPARLVRIKYPDTFVRAMQIIKGVHFVLVGSGPLEDELRELTSKASVTMVPYQQEDDMIKLYAVADFFCLPSVTDASPLTTIEAICCSLPIIVSNRVGNINDVLVEGENGYSFDPYSVEEIVKAFDCMLGHDNMEISRMKQKSRQLYLKTFENRKCLISYAMELKSLVK